MQFTVKIIATSVENKGKYNMLEVTFKRLDTGKVESKKLVSFGDGQAVYKAVVDTKADDVLNVITQKNEKTGYWDWTSVTVEAPGYAPPNASGLSTKPQAQPVVRSTYETPEERAKKQVLIVKQSSLSAAVNLLSIGAKTPPSRDLVLQEAQALADWVFEDNKPQELSIADMPNDDFPD